MSSQIETQALRMLRALLASTGGRPQQWRSLLGLPGATDAAVQYAVEQGWVIVEGGHSVALTDHGRQRATG